MLLLDTSLSCSVSLNWCFWTVCVVMCQLMLFLDSLFCYVSLNWCCFWTVCLVMCHLTDAVFGQSVLLCAT